MQWIYSHFNVTMKHKLTIIQTLYCIKEKCKHMHVFCGKLRLSSCICPVASQGWHNWAEQRHSAVMILKGDRMMNDRRLLSHRIEEDKSDVIIVLSQDVRGSFLVCFFKDFKERGEKKTCPFSLTASMRAAPAPWHWRVSPLEHIYLTGAWQSQNNSNKPQALKEGRKETCMYVWRAYACEHAFRCNFWKGPLWQR